jgi:hypothetical protein
MVAMDVKHAPVSLGLWKVNKMTAFWDRAQCSLVGVHGRFGDAYCLHHQGGLHEVNLYSSLASLVSHNFKRTFLRSFLSLLRWHEVPKINHNYVNLYLFLFFQSSVQRSSLLQLLKYSQEVVSTIPSSPQAIKHGGSQIRVDETQWLSWLWL